jgi:DNA (cytosine-5)-methyltransferase 1
MFPTPGQSEYKDTGPVGSKSHKHMLDRDYLCAVTKEESNPTGTLNPQWVEWIMGYPIGWTDLKD